jgi:exopolysaccharide biosynthesis polyprenyl glycosylphosphotransferase
MSIFNQRVESAEATAANAAVSPPNFAVPVILAEPISSPSHVVNTRRQSITDRELTMVQVCADFVLVCIAIPVALLLLSRASTVPANNLHHLLDNIEIDSLFPVAVIASFALGGMYRVTHRRLQPSAFLEIRELCFGVGSGCVLALGMGAFLHVSFGATEPIATQLVMEVIIGVVVISLGRMVLRYFLCALTTTRVLVVGSGKLVDRIMLSVRQDPAMTLIGRASDGDEYDPEAVGRVSDLPRLCNELDVHRILVASPNHVSTESLNTYRQLQESVHIAMVPRYYELVSWRSRLTDLSGMPFLEIARPHLSVWDQFMKRLFDIFISGIFLLVTAPLMLVVAIGVKLSSPGPVFFRQTRLGQGKVPFKVVKFRTMTVERDAKERYPRVAEDGDEYRPLYELHCKSEEFMRITRFGAFLRRTGLDEIPQFINVFKGHMSVVGPRPFIPEESGVAGWGTRRFDVRPGITGLWQVSGRNDLSRSDLVQLDYLYVASWSLWWDLKIMWETPKTMARGTGAY